jgi:hypothetical protein
MAAGYDEGSPAKQYADRYRKLRGELVKEFRLLLETTLKATGRWEIVLEQMQRIDLSMEKLVQ